MSQPVQLFCRCGAQLMAPPGAPSVQCPSCRVVVAVSPVAAAGPYAPPMAAKSNTWLIVALVLAGIGGVVAVIVFSEDSGGGYGGSGYGRKSKTTESREFVKKIYDGARAYYLDEHYDRSAFAPIPRQLPGPSTPLTPPDPTACCEKCMPDAMQWAPETWVALQFSVDDPHYYSYQYIVAADGQSFTARALGDLDCDGEYSTFEMYGTVEADGTISGHAGLYRINELE